MCRNIKTLANFEPPATDDEVRASALQFVPKLSGTSKPSRANEDAFNAAVEEVTAAANKLVRSLKTTAPPRNREVEILKARERSAKRFAYPDDQNRRPRTRTDCARLERSHRADRPAAAYRLGESRQVS